MQNTVYLTAFVMKNNVRIELEKVNTRSFSPAMVRFSDAGSLFQGAEFAKGFCVSENFQVRHEGGTRSSIKNQA